MVALLESVVEWTALALGVALFAALLLHGCVPLRRSGYWLPGVALAVIVANAGIAVNAAAAVVRSETAGAAAAAVGLGAIAALACLVVLLMVWLYLSRSLRVLPAAPAAAEDCCGNCSHCTLAGVAEPMETLGRKRARGLTMTRLGGE